MNLDFFKDKSSFTFDIAETAEGDVLLIVLWEKYSAELRMTFESYDDACKWIYHTGQISDQV